MTTSVPHSPVVGDTAQVQKMPVGLKVLPFVPLLLGRSSMLDLACGLLVTGIMVRLAFRPEFVAVFGFLLAYSPIMFVFAGGPSIASVFVVLGALRLFLSRENQVPWTARDSVLVVLLAATALVISQYIGSLDLVVMVLGFATLVSSLREMRSPAMAHVRGYLLWTTVCSAVTAVGYGLVNDGYMVGGAGLTEDVNRFTGTFTDPNYMALVLCIALAYVWQVPGWTLVTRLGLAAILTGGVFITGSLTGLLTALATMAAFLALRIARGRPIGVILVLAGSVAAVLGAFGALTSFGLVPDALQERIAVADQALVVGDVSEATSGRSSGQEAYLDFWSAQETADQWLGGYAVSSMALEGPPFSGIGYAPHNSHLDVLFTVGLLGVGAWIFLIVSATRQSWRQVIVDSDGVALALLVGKITWLIFSGALSLYPSWQFLFFLMVA